MEEISETQFVQKQLNNIQSEIKLNECSPDKLASELMLWIDWHITVPGH